MSAIVGERDKLLQSAVPRLGTSVSRDLLVTPSASVFKVNRDNIATPPAITLTPLLIGMTGTVTYELPEGVTLTYPGGVATLEYGNMPDSSATITASITVAGVTYKRPVTITKQFDTTSAAIYTWVKFGTSSVGTGLSNSPVGATYIGLAFNKSVASESTNATDYRWYPIDGAPGIGLAGDTGADGQQLYAWVKYSDSPDGANLYDAPTLSTLYLGLSVNQVSALESVAPSAYVWSKFGGDTGVPAQAGGTTFTWIKYGSSINGAGIADDPTGLDYIGFAYNKPTPVESTNAADYQWSLFRGGQGPSGNSFYTWIKYADAPDGTGLYDLPNGNTLYIGIAVNQVSATESNSKFDYTWSRFKGADGVPGNPGNPGMRGNVNISAPTTGNAWSDSEGATAIQTAGYGQPIAKDIVALYNTTTSKVFTRLFTGAAWVTLAQYLDGALFVKGTIYGEALVADAVTTDKLAATAVTADKLAAKAVTAEKIDVSRLSAITATIGDLQTATYGRRTRIRDDKVYQYDIYNNYIMQIGEFE